MVQIVAQQNATEGVRYDMDSFGIAARRDAFFNRQGCQFIDGVARDG